TTASAPDTGPTGQSGAGDDAADSAEAEDEAEDAEEFSTRQEHGEKTSPAPMASSMASPTASPLRSPLGRAFTGSAARHRVTVTAVPTGPRTDLTVRIEGARVGTESRLVIIGKDGTRERTGPWRINRATYEDGVVFRHETGTALADIAAFEIIGDGELLVRIPVTGTGN
ncbi:hypothetical protein OUY22_11485, partial [Nonomuraea sp. MCN248]